MDECPYKSSLNDKTRRVCELLKDKCLDDDLIKEIIEQGLTDEVTNKLHCQGFTYDEIVSVGKALREDSSSEDGCCDCDCDCETEVSKEYLESGYLKEHFGKILPTALRDIVARKPYNPIEYLGHWLLYYKECEDRENRRMELEEELNEERLKLRKPSVVTWEPSEEFELIEEQDGTNESAEVTL